MKILELDLKKKVLIIDAENGFNHFKIYDDEIGFIFIENGIPRKELVKGSYRFLCKGSELTEEIASELAFDGFNISENKKVYVDHCDECNCFESAIKSVISYVRIEGFHWLENPNSKTYFNPEEYIESEFLEFKESEEKTFKNPLIFVKK